MIPLLRGRRAACLCLALLLAACGHGGTGVRELPLSTSSKEARSAFFAGREALDTDDRAGARERFEHALALDTGFAMAAVMLARSTFSDAESHRFARRALALRGRATPAEQILIDMIPARKRGDDARVEALARRLVALYPASPRAWLELAHALASMEKTTESRAAAERAVRMDPGLYPAHAWIAASCILREPRDASTATRHARACTALRPHLADAHILLGDTYRAQSRHATARDAYARAAQLDSTSAIAVSKMGHADTFLGRYDAARTDYMRAAAISSGYPRLHFARFETYTWLYAGENTSALAANAVLLLRLPSMGFEEERDAEAYASVYYDRFLMALHAGDTTTANAALERHAELARKEASRVGIQACTHATEAGILTLSGQLAVARGDLGTAETAADWAEDLLRERSGPSRNDDCHYLRALIAFARGEIPKAAAELARIRHDMIEATYLSARTREALGDNAAAKGLYRRVVHFNFNTVNYAIVRDEAAARLATLEHR